MTVHTEVVISCDVPSCTEIFVAEGVQSRSVAEKDAEAAGWILPDSGDDVCPSHALVMEPS